LSELENNGICVIHQANNGPSHARNTGVKQSKADYLLCLDSDNKIYPSYIDEGINALTKNPEAAIVYSSPEFIGDTNRTPFVTGPFNIEKLLLENYIDMCAVLRKSAWEQSGGLDEVLWRFEDWEFWIRLYKAGWQFVYLNKPLFQYRIRGTSLMSGAIKDDHKKMIGYLYAKHSDILYTVLHSLYARSIIYSNDIRRPLRSFIKYMKLYFEKNILNKQER
jgi:glycosyltransferase involved in cell wall biosynthesis